MSTATVTFRFYGALNDFLPADRRQRAFAQTIEPPVTVKDVVEAIGVPHPEVDLLLVDGLSVDFSYRLQADNRVAAYPRIHGLDTAAVTQVRPPQPSSWRFALDGHLGRLAAYLRLAGFDSRYERDVEDEELSRISAAEQRVLLTRDVGLLKRSIVGLGYWVRNTSPQRQLEEVAGRFELSREARPFTRCLRCNGLLQPVAKADVLDRLPPRTRAHYDEFLQCAGCGRVYWQGGHYRSLQRQLESCGFAGPRDKSTTRPTDQ